MNNLFDELKRRNVIKSSLAYLVVAWVLLQVFSLLLPMVNAPEWVLKTLTLAMIIVFPLWVFFSWAYEVTPEGIKRTAEVSKEDSISALTNKRLNGLILVALVAAIAVGLLNRPNNNTNEDTSINNEILDGSIAVLPFDDMSSGGDAEWFCDGVTEDILTNLSKIKELKVISRTSTERYKETDLSIPEIAKELGVSYIVEGSVRKHEDKVIITAQLIDANDKHLWADNYNDTFEEVFEIQKDVSKKIVKQLKIAISPEEEEELDVIPTKNMKAYELLLKARSFSDKGTKEDYFISIDLYQQAVDLDPDFAEAYAEMASNYVVNSYLDLNNDDQNIYTAKELVDKALKIDPNSSKALSIKGALYWYDNNYEEAKEYLEKALELSPNDVISNRYMAIFYWDGRYKDIKKALYHINKAAELDPFSAVINEYKIGMLMDDKKLAEAERLFKDKIFLFSDYNKNFLQNSFIEARSTALSIEEQDWMERIRYYEKEIKKDSLNPFIYVNLGLAYKQILNDNKNRLKYAKRAYELDSTEVDNAIQYFMALVNDKEFIEALQMINSEYFKSIMSDTYELISMVVYYDSKEDYKAALEVLKDTLMTDKYTLKAYVLANQGKVEEVRNILNKKDAISNMSKANIFAILENRDSMYYYLDKEKDIENRIRFNGNSEADPYRKEARYKEYLKKNYLPITHWNE